MQDNPKTNHLLSSMVKSVFAKIIRAVQYELRQQRFLPVLIAGFLTTIMDVTFGAALGLSLFPAEMSAYTARGIGFLLFGQLLVVFCIALFSSFRCVIAGVQESPMAIFILMSIALKKIMTGNSIQEQFFTIVAAVALTTILTGLVYCLLGFFKLGNLVRYIPYPVIGGFLAGTGLLIVFGSLSVMVDLPVSFLDLHCLTDPVLYLKWLPGILFGLILIFLLKKWNHILIIPAMMFVTMVGFYIVLWLNGISIEQAAERGYLLSIFSQIDGGLWQPFDRQSFPLINWTGILSQAGSIFAVLVISSIALLLNVTSLEISTGEKIDLNRELTVSGIANILAGLGGGGIGFHAVGDTQLAYRLDARSRLTGLIQGFLTLLVLFGGGQLLAYIPVFILGGFLAFIGLDLMNVWFVDTLKKVPVIDFAIIVVIALVINLFGILEGVGFGLVLTVFQFILCYSRISVVKHELSGSSFRSNVVRPRMYQQLLSKKGEWMCIFELQGFIFFGTSNELYHRIQQRVENQESSRMKYIVLDFSRVTGLDMSAVFSFEKLFQLTQNEQIELIFCGLGRNIQRQMKIVLDSDGMRDRQFDDLDHAVEWCEDRIIDTFESVGLAAKPETLVRQLEKALPDQIHSSDFFSYMQRIEYSEGEILIGQGEKQDAVYFIEEGTVSVWLCDGHKQKTRIRRMASGTVVGELGFYLGTKATASVIAEEMTVAYRLTRENLNRMENENIQIANGLHKFLAGLLSERLILTNDVLQSLSR